MAKNYSLVGVDGNAYSIMGYVRKAMRECGCTKEELTKYMEDATRGNYDELLIVSADKINELNQTNYA